MMVGFKNGLQRYVPRHKKPMKPPIMAQIIINRPVLTQNLDLDFRSFSIYYPEMSLPWSLLAPKLNPGKFLSQNILKIILNSDFTFPLTGK